MTIMYLDPWGKGTFSLVLLGNLVFCDPLNFERKRTL